MNKPTHHSLIELLKLYSDTEIVRLINSVNLQNGPEPSVKIPYEDLLSEMENRDIDCSHVRDYNRNLNEMFVELREINDKKRLFANWMMMFTDEDYAIISNKADEEEEEEDEIEYDFPVYCPICDKLCECGHIVAIYDDSYHNFEGGDVYGYIGEFREIIRKGFRHLLKRGKLHPAFTLQSLTECWEEFQSYEPRPDDEEVEIDDRLANRVILNLLRYEGADWDTNEVASSGPGASSSEDFLFANDPIKVIKSAIARLKKEFPGVRRK